MDQIASRSKCDVVTDSIIREIVNGTYPTDSQLPTENELCEKFGVSRITVRESLKRLSTMGIVSIQQGRGTFVSSVDVGTFMSPLLPLIEFENFDIATIYDARLYLETGTCRLAAHNRTEGDVDTLKRYVSQMDEGIASGDMQRMIDFDMWFHIKIAEISGNQILKASVINLERLSKACAIRLNKVYALMDEANEQHRKIAKAIAQKDADAAEREIVEHTLKSKQFLTNH